MNKKILGGILGLGFLLAVILVPQNQALAQNVDNTVEALQRQVNSLLEMVKSLQKQIEALRGQVKPPVVVPSKPIEATQRISGLLELQGPSIYMWGSHTLKMADGKSYLVKAANDEVLSLLKKYEGLSPILVGKLEYQNLEGGFWGFIAKKVYNAGWGCVVPAKVKIGYKGDDIKILQQYLATDSTIYPEGMVTGYYGQLTKKAIEKFQEKRGLHKSGELDEDTKEKLEIEIESSEKVRCVPQPLPAPLPDQGFRVYSPQAGEDLKVGQTYKVAWNQVWPTFGCVNSGSQPTICVDPASSTNPNFAAVKEVKITLHKYFACLYSNPRCMIAEPAPYVISEKTENDGVFEWTIPNLDSVYKGQVIITVSAVGGGFSGRSGVFEIKLNDTSANKPPVISGVSGPVLLKVQETGTWTIRAYDPENKSLSYSVRWGDEPTTTQSELNGAPAARVPVQNLATFTHVYSQSGRYEPVFWIYDDLGQSAKTSMAVMVDLISNTTTTTTSTVN